MLLELFLLLYVAWGIGTNEEAFVKAVASRSLKVKTAVLLTAIAALIGAAFFGQLVSKTLDSVVIIDEKPREFVLSIMTAVGIWFTLSVVFKLPVSTISSIVGALFGAAIFYRYQINRQIVVSIFSSWIISILASFIFAYLLYKMMSVLHLFYRNMESRELLERTSAVLLVIISFLSVISRAANDVAGAIFLVGYSEDFRLLGGLGLVVGVLTFSGRIIRNVGVNLVELSPTSALAAQISSFFVSTFFVAIAMPISSSAVTVSSLVGMGMARKARVNINLFKNIVYGWFITMPLCGLLTYAILVIL